MGILTIEDVENLGNYVSYDGHIIRPGCYFVAEGGGLAAEAIQLFTRSWAGHAGIYIGEYGGKPQQMVEGLPPVARVMPMDSRSEARFNYREGAALTPEQRWKIVTKAISQIGTEYDIHAYLGFVLEHYRIGSEEFRDKHYESARQVCSALVATCYAEAGIDLDPYAKIHNLITPADLYDRIATY